MTNIQHLLITYGNWIVPIFLFMAIENVYIPIAAGEPLLLVAAISAGTTHNFPATLLVCFVAIAGSSAGSCVGFWIGRTGGFRLIARYGHIIRLNESKMKLGMYLFRQYGGRVALFGRCIPIIRGYVPFIAGTYQMRWPNFILANALGSGIQAIVFGLGGYMLGQSMQGFVWIVPILAIVIALILLTPLFLRLRRQQRQMEKQAEELFPGPLNDYFPGSRREAALEKEELKEPVRR
jgi:membrane protein DedA with SNARE-associated domain